MLSVPPERRPLLRRGAMAIGKQLAGFSAAVMAFAGTASPANTSSTTMPQDVRALIAPTDTLLAYKAADLYGGGSWAAVVVVRHPASEMSDLDFDHNPCDLRVLRRQNGKIVEVDHSKKAVDCTYNDVERHAPPMSLSDYINVSLGSITFVNQQRHGWSSFEFAWSKGKGTWYLHRATASNVDSENNGTQTTVSYPKDLVWTSMSSVDPEAIAEVLEKRVKTKQ